MRKTHKLDALNFLVKDDIKFIYMVYSWPYEYLCGILSFSYFLTIGIRTDITIRCSTRMCIMKLVVDPNMRIPCFESLLGDESIYGDQKVFIVTWMPSHRSRCCELMVEWWCKFFDRR